VTALAEALLTAQRGALAAMQKAFVRGALTGPDFKTRLDAIGCSDVTDGDTMISALNVMREFGAEPPQPTKPDTGSEPASDRQTAYIQKLADERGTVAPDYKLTKDNASKVIEQLKAGTYNPDEWTVPF